jgi:hypothetical protein
MTIGCGMPIMDCWMVRHLSLTPDMTPLSSSAVLARE